MQADSGRTLVKFQYVKQHEQENMCRQMVNVNWLQRRTNWNVAFTVIEKNLQLSNYYQLM